MLATFIKHCFTGKDNETYDIARVLWAFGVIAFIACAAYVVIHSGAFDPQNFGTGFGFIMGGGGGSVWAKAKTEPDVQQTESSNDH